MKYETLKIMSRGDQAVRYIMIEKCYQIGGLDQIITHACDLIERDILEGLWKGMPFHRLLEVNVSKYFEIESEFDKEMYINLLDVINGFASQFFELMNEVDSHKEVTVLRLKELIDQRTKVIIEESRRNP